MPLLKKKVLLGMSGGVDSSVSAALLLEQGYEVIGAFMKNWSGSAKAVVRDHEGSSDPRRGGGRREAECGNEFQECDWRDERRDAIRVASQLGIPFVTFDFEKEYRAKVVDYLFREYEAGRTPNPDVMCNKFVKFDLFLREADKLGCDFIATGHYARIQSGRILAGIDDQKDQTYFLWAIPKGVLSRVLFPVGDMKKSAVRAKAEALGLSTAKKKDSTGICFVGEVDIRAFLQERLPRKPGPIVTTDGVEVGTHEGIAFYTIGQRHGLDVGGGAPYYVVDKKPATNTLVVSSAFHPSLFSAGLTAHAPNWFREPVAYPYHCQARIRYRQPLCEAVIETKQDGVLRVRFLDPQRAVTPGQSIVFYEGEEMLGGAIIGEAMGAAGHRVHTLDYLAFLC